jgi:hypothetical protein
MQLIFPPDAIAYDELRPFLTKPVECRGTLLHAITGHHHSPVLLEGARCTVLREPSGSDPVPASPVSLVRRFYGIDRHWISTSLPTADDVKRHPGLFSTRLVDLFQGARRYQERAIAQNPDRPSEDGYPPIILKPPFVDGDIFSGPQDGARPFTVLDEVVGTGQGLLVKVCSEPEYNMSPWEVSVVVIRERGRYVIDDVLYDEADGSSSDSLASYLSRTHD